MFGDRMNNLNDGLAVVMQCGFCGTNANNSHNCAAKMLAEQKQQQQQQQQQSLPVSDSDPNPVTPNSVDDARINIGVS